MDEPLSVFAQQSELCSSIAGQTVSMHYQLPSEQLHDIHVASEVFFPDHRNLLISKIQENIRLILLNTRFYVLMLK